MVLKYYVKFIWNWVDKLKYNIFRKQMAHSRENLYTLSKMNGLDPRQEIVIVEVIGIATQWFKLILNWNFQIPPINEWFTYLNCWRNINCLSFTRDKYGDYHPKRKSKVTVDKWYPLLRFLFSLLLNARR